MIRLLEQASEEHRATALLAAFLAIEHVSGHGHVWRCRLCGWINNNPKLWVLDFQHNPLSCPLADALAGMLADRIESYRANPDAPSDGESMQGAWLRILADALLADTLKRGTSPMGEVE